MFRRLAPGLAALAILLAACGSPASSPSSGAASGKSVAPAASPQGGPTPTAMIAQPAPSPSPVAQPSPSPAALASPSPSALASPAASPVAAAAPSAAGAVRYSIVSDRSEARYEVQEKFAERPLPNQAVGRTQDISGDIELEGPGSLRGRVLQMRVDLRTLTSDSGRRDAFVRTNTLQTDQFPFAEFRSTEPAGPATYTEGTEATFQIPGIMTIKGNERPITWDATARLDGERLAGTATAQIKLSDFGVEAPRLAILTVEDDMTWIVQLEAERAP